MLELMSLPFKNQAKVELTIGKAHDYIERNGLQINDEEAMMADIVEEILQDKRDRPMFTRIVQRYTSRSQSHERLNHPRGATGDHRGYSTLRSPGTCSSLPEVPNVEYKQPSGYQRAVARTRAVGLSSVPIQSDKIQKITSGHPWIITCIGSKPCVQID